jgi:hypothetical protein
VPSSSPDTFRVGTKRIPRSSNASKSAADVSGEGGIGLPNGITTVIVVESRRPSARR